MARFALGANCGSVAESAAVSPVAAARASAEKKEPPSIEVRAAPPETHGRFFPGTGAWIVGCGKFREGSMVYLFRVSSRFRNSLAIIVQAACCGAGIVVFAGESPIRISFAAEAGCFV